MEGAQGATIKEYFAALTDPHVEHAKLHLLLDILVIAICAVICRADTWVEMEAGSVAKLLITESYLQNVVVTC